MKKYKVTIVDTIMSTKILTIEAASEQEAINKACEGVGDDGTAELLDEDMKNREVADVTEAK